MYEITVTVYKIVIKGTFYKYKKSRLFNSGFY